MSAVLTAQPSLHSTMYMVRTRAKERGKKRKRKKSTMAGGACATGKTKIKRKVTKCALLGIASTRLYSPRHTPGL